MIISKARMKNKTYREKKTKEASNISPSLRGPTTSLGKGKGDDNSRRGSNAKAIEET